MELWIRSQDRKQLIKTDYIECGEWNKEYRIYMNGEVCGKYKTEERALEVLDEIQNILKPKYILNTSSIKPNGDYYEKNGVIYQNYNADAQLEQLSTYVYEMPKE